MKDEFKLCTKCNMKYNDKRCDNCNPKDEEQLPKVRTNHHRNKEEAARLQLLVDDKYKVEKSLRDTIKDMVDDVHVKSWNEAIEQAAKQAAHSIGIETLLATHVQMEIRKLKK